jgi:hypothetical protein
VKVPYGLTCCHLRGEARRSIGGKPFLPGVFFEYLLDHERIDVRQADLRQMERKHRDLLVFEFIAGELASVSMEELLKIKKLSSKRQKGLQYI